MKLSIKIKQTEVNTYLVNGKEVYEDTDGVWRSRKELTKYEKAGFIKYMNETLEAGIFRFSG